MEHKDSLLKLYQQHIGTPATTCEQLPPCGSNRTYYRLCSIKGSLIGVYNPNTEENRTFVALSEHFLKQGLSVPKVFAVSTDYTAYIQEDLGESTLFQYLESARKTGNYTSDERNILIETIRQLPQLQFKGIEQLEPILHNAPQFNLRGIMYDLNYFKYSFLKPIYNNFDEDKLQDCLEAFAQTLLNQNGETFLYRDFQARNVMVKESKPYFIDFQGGRKGPIYYDVASFVYQAKAAYPQDIRELLLDNYLDELQQYITIDKNQFIQNLLPFMLFRNLQVLGAYGFRGLLERKRHFLESIPYALDNLDVILCRYHNDQLSYLYEVLTKMGKAYREAHNKTEWGSELSAKQDIIEGGRLMVEIFSFSYKKGVPQDKSGNGGGYVFDCRALHNPGRYNEFKHLTGLDQATIEFLETKSDINAFMNSVYDMADYHVKCFMERGFTHLQFAFGCTGGQHRSAYAAEHLAKHLKSLFDIDIHLFHRELEIEKIL